ncbi:MAG: glycosyltransferase family 4 protein [Candidatus Curtissbacteria bacterium]|nr:glycosyltransferase family 4 protein [Candidatus Curtissbacteria bacterium]
MPNKLKICSPQLGLSNKSTLGGEVFDREVLLGLARRGVETTIILPKGKAHDKGIKNWHIYYLPITHFPAIAANLLYLPPLFKTYQEKKFNILRIHQPQFLGLCASLFKFFKRDVKLVATIHQFRETEMPFASKFFNNLWDHIICDSENVKNLIIKTYNVEKNKITVVHNGTPRYLKPTEKGKKLLKKLNLENKFVLMYMGFFNERKNPLFLLKVLSEIKKTNKNVALVYWGEGPLKSEIKKRAISLNLSSDIRFITPKFGPEKNKFHNLADVFVHPSLDEGFALAPLEAMACAKPVIMNNSHSAREAIDNGINGFICEQSDVDAWCRALIKILGDKKLANKMGKEAYQKRLKEFNWKKTINAHERVFNRLLI